MRLKIRTFLGRNCNFVQNSDNFCINLDPSSNSILYVRSRNCELSQVSQDYIKRFVSVKVCNGTSPFFGTSGESRMGVLFSLRRLLIIIVLALKSSPAYYKEKVLRKEGCTPLMNLR